MAKHHHKADHYLRQLKKEKPMLSVPLDEENILALAHCILKKRFKQLSEPLEEIRLVKAFLISQLARKEQEIFACLFLDNNHCLIDYRELFFGSINYTAIYPREVVKLSLSLNAAAVIAVHNHPSGQSKPSTTDIEITEDLKKALALMDIQLLDHFIVAGLEMVSLKEMGKC